MKHTVTEVKLKNGAKGLFINIPGASVMHYEFNFVGGDFMSPERKWDTAHLLEHVVTGANELIRNGRQFSAELEKNGAVTNAYTSTNYIGYWAECADFEWQRILELLIVRISKPIFLREEFKAEVGNIKDELTAWTNNHFAQLNADLSTAQGLTDLNDRERLKQLRNIRRIDIINLYKRTHSTSNMRFIVAGNLTGHRSTIEKMIEKISLPKGRGRIPLLDDKPRSLEKTLFVSRPSVRNTHFFIKSFALERLTDDKSDALTLVNNMLTATLHSRIFGEARERGLVYDLESGIMNSVNFSSWYFAAQVLPKNTQALFEIIVRELGRVNAGDISDEDLKSAKLYALGRYQLSGQTVRGVSSGYAGRYWFDGTIRDYEAFPEHIKAITKKLMVETSNRMFSDKIGGLGLLGNARSKELAEPLFEMIQPLWR